MSRVSWKKERDQLQGILASERKVNNLLKKELQADAQLR